jgi:ligand-binding sensor domain-containing protein
MLILIVSVQAQEKIDGWLVFNTSNSNIPNNHVRDIQFDKKGYLWLATWGGALSRFNQDDGSWMFYNQGNSEVPGSYINQIFIDKTNKIWVAAKEGFGSFDGRETWENVRMPSGVEAQSIAVNKGGVALIGSVKHGLFVYSKEKILSKIWGEDNNIDAGVTDITFDDKGNAIVCTRLGLLRFSVVPGGMYTSIHKKLSDFHCTKAEYDKKNETIWAIEGKNLKVVKYRKGKWKIYNHTTPDLYMSINKKPETYHVSELCLVNSKRYTMAIGTYYFGGVAVNGGRFWGSIVTPYSSVNMTGGIEALAQDKRDALWVGTWNHGLMVRTGEDLDDITEEIIELTDEELELPEEEQLVIIKKRKEQKKMVRTRSVEVKDTIYSSTKEVDILVWDAQKIDGDTVSIMLNGKFILENHPLTKAPKRLKATLQPNNNRLVLYAHNLGTIPPNTASISILHLDSQQEVSLMSDKKNSQAVIVIHDVFETVSPVDEENK